MPAVLQICIVIVTLGLLACALFTVRLISRFFIQAAREISDLTLAVRQSVAQIEQFTGEARTVVDAIRGCVPPVRRMVDRFEVIGQRTADVSSTLLTELEIPVFTAAAVTGGVRAGASHLLRRVMQRVMHRTSPLNGDNHHE